jgi:hypothetical protein
VTAGRAATEATEEKEAATGVVVKEVASAETAEAAVEAAAAHQAAPPSA